MVTGSVTDEDDVPKAVTRAGTMATMSSKGLALTTAK